MLRALRTGLFIGIVLGGCACASVQEPGSNSQNGPYGAIDGGIRR